MQDLPSREKDSHTSYCINIVPQVFVNSIPINLQIVNGCVSVFYAFNVKSTNNRGGDNWNFMFSLRLQHIYLLVQEQLIIVFKHVISGFLCFS